MEMNVYKDNKTVEIWLANNEKDSEEIAQRLDFLYDLCKSRKFFVAVYRSGKENLCTQTSQLLCYNKKRAVKSNGCYENQGAVGE